MIINNTDGSLYSHESDCSQCQVSNWKSYVQYFSSFLYAHCISTAKTTEPLHPDTIHIMTTYKSNTESLLYIGWAFVYNQYNK